MFLPPPSSSRMMLQPAAQSAMTSSAAAAPAAAASAPIWPVFALQGALQAIGQIVENNEKKKMLAKQMRLQAAESEGEGVSRAASTGLQGQQNAYQQMMQAYQQALGGY